MTELPFGTGIWRTGPFESKNIPYNMRFDVLRRRAMTGLPHSDETQTLFLALESGWKWQIQVSSPVTISSKRRGSHLSYYSITCDASLTHWLIDWMVFYAGFNSISVISRRQLIIHAFLGFTSTRLGSEMSYPRTLPRKNPEDLVQLEPRTPGLRVKHLATQPRGTQKSNPTLFLLISERMGHPAHADLT